MIRHEKICEGNLSTSLLEGSKGSDAALSDCENRTGADPKLNDVVLVGKGKNRHGGSRVEPLPISEKRMQVRAVDQTAYPLQTSVASLATD